MITVGMNYNVIPGKEKVFEDAFASVIKVMDQGEGHKKSFLYREVHANGKYLIISEWDDEVAFRAFIKSEAFAKVTNWGKEQILAGRPEHKVYKN